MMMNQCLPAVPEAAPSAAPSQSCHLDMVVGQDVGMSARETSVSLGAQ